MREPNRQGVTNKMESYISTSEILSFDGGTDDTWGEYAGMKAGDNVSLEALVSILQLRLPRLVP